MRLRILGEGFLEDGSLAPIWPGGYAESFSPEETNCFPAKRFNDDCWIETNRFISNQDVYMEFDDRWAHRGSQVNDNVYESTGYPMGLRVMATAHSYSVAFAEDIMFVTVDVKMKVEIIGLHLRKIGMVIESI